jgi:DNA repair exonuclease SbcCD ATPase subunit
MSSNSSKKFHITLPFVEGNEIETIATERGVSAAHIIRERLSEWQPQSTEETTHTAFTAQLQQLSEQLDQVQQALEQLGDRSTQSDPQIRALLQPVHTRLQQIETQVGVMGNLTQQMAQQIGKHQLRLEAWLEAVYVIVQPLLTDHQLEEVQKERQKWIKELQQRLEQHLEAHQ